MSDLNQCQFIGRLGRDPEVRYTPSGDACANFSIAVGESWKDKATGERKQVTEWIRCVAWRQLGEIIGKYLVKGSQVFISGKMKTRKWTDKDGAEHYTTEILVDQMQMLGSKPGAEGSGGERPAASRPSAAKPAAKQSGGFDDLDDDIPF